MSNIIAELGASFISERFHGCMFFDEEGEVQYIDNTGRWPTGRVGTIRVRGTPDKYTAERHSMPNEFFKDLSVFSVPPLGWRSAGDGAYMAYFRRNNKSYHRAIAKNNLHTRLSPASDWLRMSGNLDTQKYTEQAAQALLVMKPEYIPFRQGLERMREGELFSFATGPTIAVMPAPNDCQTILFNQHEVATVLPDGELRFINNDVQDYVREQL